VEDTVTRVQSLIKLFFRRWDPSVAVVLADAVEEMALLALAKKLRLAVEDDGPLNKSYLQSVCARVEDLVHLMGMKNAFPSDFTFETWWNPHFERVLREKDLCGFRWQGRNNERDPKRTYVKREPFEEHRACTLSKGHKGNHKHDHTLGMTFKKDISLPKRRKAA